MYKRSYGMRRPPYVPEDYGGSVFANVPPAHRQEDKGILYLEAEREQSAEEERVTEKVHKEIYKEEKCEKKPQCENKGLPAIGGKLFPRGLGSEELLLLGLILILSDNGENNEVLIMLAILLFC